ncbi:hypothetical protein LSH36_350g04046 [Paralvinella palmiformis]|uniref:alpha-1,6-mannosyl-glycoprotein 6-beta-N-acetylglucosaminyltransferase n=1 Tax=Paralvinella palmiformis TaxID=53620 RepID=A0AAD9JEU0_9ANNE|nr:hypothetical protein LSH36_350g04046 [Paralvinella palmiformis]
MPTIKVKKLRLVLVSSLIMVMLFKVSSYHRNEGYAQKPVLERIHAEADIIKRGLSTISWKQGLHYDEVDDSMIRYEGMSTCNRSTVLVIPGLLKGTNFVQHQSLDRGGPLGELLQWSDLIAGLYVLGHDVTLEHDTRIVSMRLLEYINRHSSDCDNEYDIIYLDRPAMATFPMEVQKAYRCCFRLLDVYGTQAMYRDPIYKETHLLQGARDAELLELKQYYTFYPQTPDNTFLGFVVTEKKDRNKTKKQDIAVLYGKNMRYLRGKEHYISLLTKYLDVHYTMPQPLSISAEARLYNDGILSSSDYATLLDRAKIVVGLGHPIEGTGAMEALAHGCVFFNPKYIGTDQNIFKNIGKPTHRLITSQIPYLEQYVGPPNVYTINTNNDTEVITNLRKALHQTDFAPFIPYEFTMVGYLDRLAMLIEHQNFCRRDRNTTWPPMTLLISIEADIGQSCSTGCDDKGSLDINCQLVLWDADIVHPSVKGNRTYQACTLQENNRLFSCEGTSSDSRRICPCRRYKKYQVALPD